MMGIAQKADRNTFGERAGSAKTLADFVCEAIRERLRDGRLQPGDRLTVVKLAAELEVSRTPVQEAVNRLGREGLLVVQPHQGAMITDLEPGQANACASDGRLPGDRDKLTALGEEGLWPKHF